MTDRPFFNVHSSALRDMLGVEDVRSVRAKIKKIGVEIYGSGKDSYIVTEEVIEALRGKKHVTHVSYQPKGDIYI